MPDKHPQRVYREIRDKAAGRGKGEYRHLYQALADRITARRLELEMSQTDLAKACGTTQSAIARLERGDRPPRVDTLLTVAEALNCDVAVELVPRSERTDG